MLVHDLPTLSDQMLSDGFSEISFELGHIIILVVIVPKMLILLQKVEFLCDLKESRFVKKKKAGPTNARLKKW
jgi:hypothetical protein